MLPAHPATDLFPMFGDDALSELASDIAEHGLLYPIVLHEGLVLDGRNRLAACELAGVEPRFVEWEPEGWAPTAWVIATNLHRRHLTTSQRAAIGAEAMPMLMAEARERQMRAGRVNLHPESVSIDADSGTNRQSNRSARVAGALVGVSSATVNRARAIQKADPELFEQVKDGDMSVNAALTTLGAPVSRASKRERDEPIKADTQRGQMLGEAGRRRLVEGLAYLTGAVRGLSEDDFGKVAAVASKEELDSWCRQLSTLVSDLSKVRARLRSV